MEGSIISPLAGDLHYLCVPTELGHYFSHVFFIIWLVYSDLGHGPFHGGFMIIDQYCLEVGSTYV